MSEKCIVVVSFKEEDVPLMHGTYDECVNYIRTINKAWTVETQIEQCELIIRRKLIDRDIRSYVIYKLAGDGYVKLVAEFFNVEE